MDGADDPGPTGHTRRGLLRAAAVTGAAALAGCISLPAGGGESPDAGSDRATDARDVITLAVGVTRGRVARAYPFGAVREAGVVNDSVGGLPVAVTVTPAGSMAA